MYFLKTLKHPLQNIQKMSLCATQLVREFNICIVTLNIRELLLHKVPPFIPTDSVMSLIQDKWSGLIVTSHTMVVVLQSQHCTMVVVLQSQHCTLVVELSSPSVIMTYSSIRVVFMASFSHNVFTKQTMACDFFIYEKWTTHILFIRNFSLIFIPMLKHTLRNHKTILNLAIV